ncbi:MAG: beta-lactamase family protein [Pseudorhodobacter sp.]|nr:beta-lactamase family protein [Rhizobacter sp.]
MPCTPVPDFSSAHAVLQAAVDAELLPGASAIVWRDGEVIADFCTGYADIERGELLQPSHIHRAFSNTKLLTSVLVLKLVDEGCFALDDPIKTWLPAMGHLRVLRRGATQLTDTDALQKDITVRQLLSHQAGFSHGVFDPGTVIFDAYQAAGLRRSDAALDELMARLTTLPLLYQPGDAWEYSMAPDVLARLIEIVTGKSFAQALQTHLLEPLGMVDTAFVLRPDQAPRLSALYGGDRLNPTSPGLTQLLDTPWPQAHLRAVPREGGSSGLCTTQRDMIALLKGLLPGPDAYLSASSLAEMLKDQVPPERCVQFALGGPMPHMGFGLGGAITRVVAPGQSDLAVGELQWGGLAGTHWWVSPAARCVGVLMTQRHFGFWNPFWFDYKQQVYRALSA